MKVFSGSIPAKALLFPMESVYESYVAQQIKRVFSVRGWEVTVLPALTKTISGQSENCRPLSTNREYRLSWHKTSQPLTENTLFICCAT